MTVLEMAEMVRDAVDGSLEMEYRPLPVDDPCRRRPDITRATELLGWRPRVSVSEGLAKTIEWFRRKLAKG